VKNIGGSDSNLQYIEGMDRSVKNLEGSDSSQLNIGGSDSSLQNIGGSDSSSRILEEVTVFCRIMGKVKGICKKFYDEKLKNSKSPRRKKYIFIYELFKHMIKYLRINNNKRQVYWWFKH
jgi:hypothetical protein